MQEKLSAYDKINNRFKKLSGGQSLEDRAAYYKKETEKGKKKLEKFRKTGQLEMFTVYEMFKRLINPIEESTEPFDILTTKLKGMLESMEGGNTRLAYYAAAHLMLNEDWEDSWGGAIELWDQKMKKNFVKVFPKINNAVIFRTDTESNHGFPDPINCPNDKTHQ